MTGDRWLRWGPLRSPLGRRLLAAFLLVALFSVGMLTAAALVGTAQGLASARQSDRQEAATRTAEAAAAAGTGTAASPAGAGTTITIRLPLTNPQRVRGPRIGRFDHVAAPSGPRHHDRRQ